MKTRNNGQGLNVGLVTAVTALLIGLGGCSNMTQQEKGTAVGAGIGALGGAALTGGSALGTVGGAAVGGVIGHEVEKPPKSK